MEYHPNPPSRRLLLPRLGGLLLAGLLLAAVGPGAVRAQTPLGPVAEDAFQALLELPDDQVPTAYVPGSLDRAARLQLRLKAIYQRLGIWMKLEEGFRVLVLSPREWQALGSAQPYGFPARVDLSTAAVAAWGTPESVEVWKDLLGTLPRPEGFSARGSREEVASLLLGDALVELEMCRAVVYRQRLAGGTDGAWLNDLLAHLVCTGADRLLAEPGLVPLEPLLGRLASTQGGKGVPDLAAYGGGFGGDSGGGLGWGRWMAYQAHFARGADLMWQAGGKQSVRKLLRVRRRKGSPLVFEDLLRLFPGLEEWRGPGG